MNLAVSLLDQPEGVYLRGDASVIAAYRLLLSGGWPSRLIAQGEMARARLLGRATFHFRTDADRPVIILLSHDIGSGGDDFLLELLQEYTGHSLPEWEDELAHSLEAIRGRRLALTVEPEDPHQISQLRCAPLVRLLPRFCGAPLEGRGLAVRLSQVLAAGPTQLHARLSWEGAAEEGVWLGARLTCLSQERIPVCLLPAPKGVVRGESLEISPLPSTGYQLGWQLLLFLRQGSRPAGPLTSPSMATEASMALRALEGVLTTATITR